MFDRFELSGDLDNVAFPPIKTTPRLVPRKAENALMNLWRLAALPDSAIAAWDSYSQGPVSPFLTYGFALAVANAGGDVYAAVTAQNGIRIFPFEYRSVIDKVLRIATRVGAEMSDQMGVVGEGTTGDVRALALPLSAIHVNHYRDDDLWSWNSTEKKAGMLTDLGAGVENYWHEQRQRCKQRFTNLRNRRAKIERELGPLSVEHSAAIKSGDIEKIISEKRRQYRDTRVYDVFSKPRNVRILAELARLKRRDCVPLCSKLYAGDHLVAMHFGLKNSGYLNYWFPVYFLPYRQYSPGLLLLESIISEAASLGVTRIDYGEGVADYKSMFANRTYFNVKATWRSASVLGSVAGLKEAIYWRAAKAKRVVLHGGAE